MYGNSGQGGCLAYLLITVVAPAVLMLIGWATTPGVAMGVGLAAMVAVFLTADS